MPLKPHEIYFHGKLQGGKVFLKKSFQDTGSHNYLRPYPRAVESESPGCGPRNQYFFKLPRRSQWVTMVELRTVGLGQSQSSGSIKIPWRAY